MVVGAVVLWRVATSSTPVSEEQALADFRQTGSAGTGGGAPAPGVYTYRASGSEAGLVGPLRMRRPVPGEVRYIVTATDDGYVGEWRISGEHAEGYRFRLTPQWHVLAWRRVDVTFLGVGRDDRRDVVGSPRWIPRRPRVGMRWPLRFSTGTLRSTGEGAVVARQQMQVAGTAREVAVIDIRTVTTGAHGGRHHERIWWSVADGLPLRLRTETRLDGVVGFQSQATYTLTALTPAR